MKKRQQQFSFLTLTIPTETQTNYITQTQTGQLTTVYQTSTTTLTPSYFQDTNVITQDIVTGLLVILIILLSTYFGYQQRLKSKLKLADAIQNKKDQLYNNVTGTIAPID